jgi:hypothetical protein
MARRDFGLLDWRIACLKKANFLPLYNWSEWPSYPKGYWSKFRLQYGLHGHPQFS